ncbi:metallophosphoesterase [Fimbriiglobus ruber]|uniref:Metallophosphoesterase n=1 Tax=Fimbriiglobus ruber TaxID=1908690 RepID=A0A225DEF1_9BACT|nr:metallophosphoesterase [Fimbriiglobus ruber]OWK34497.1 Metallophosphoesterase [Fimbriiglobus ruber]
MPSHAPKTYLVFGDLHGRVLPAVRLASVWARDHNQPVDGILQVGDLGYFPDPTRLDKATIRHAKDDPLELGVQDIVSYTKIADDVFADAHVAPGLWFTAGNHEDFDELERRAGASGRGPDFVVDAYCRVRGIKDGRAVPFPDGPTVGAIWGVDGAGANRRTNLPDRGYVRERAVTRLLDTPFDVLLCHDAPLDAKRTGYGSELLAHLIHLARPAFAFFGHYKGAGGPSLQDFGCSRVYHLAGFELHGRGGTPEPGSVGVLTWQNGEGRFEYLPDEWTRIFTRHNWKWR